MYGWIGSNYMMICKTKYIFLSSTLLKGGKFTINSAKRRLFFRLIELQPGECLF